MKMYQKKKLNFYLLQMEREREKDRLRERERERERERRRCYYRHGMMDVCGAIIWTV